MSGDSYSFNSIPNDRFLRNFSWQFYLLTEFFPQICWEEIAEEILFQREGVTSIDRKRNGPFLNVWITISELQLVHL